MDARNPNDVFKESLTHPKFLHSNSTSHVWAFGAIAELIDNARDPDVMAKRLYISVESTASEKLLTFTDDGHGMTGETLHKMLSFGYCDKIEIAGHKPIGHYGNGFKSGSMRLGKDALVFTKHMKSWSIGFLSQTFLAAIQAKSVKVPMVTLAADSGKVSLNQRPDAAALENFEAMFKYSPFASKDQLMSQFDFIESTTGTRIVIFKLRREEGINELEFDFEEDPRDIRLRVDPNTKKHISRDRTNQGAATEIPLDYSLRAYCEVLYLRPRMMIYIRGRRVKTKLIEHSLTHTKVDTYRPNAAKEPTKITFGINPENKQVYGMMLYHRNRLIKPYVRVGMQLSSGNNGVGVIGVVEADWLQPTHNKQDFDLTAAYRNCIVALAERLATYWWELKEKKKEKAAPRASSAAASTAAVDDEIDVKNADETWVQCEKCQKWRRLPANEKAPAEEDFWSCEMNKDTKHNLCDLPEEQYNEPQVDPALDLRKAKQAKNRVEKEELERKQREETKKQIEALMKKREEERIMKENQEKLAKMIAEQKRAEEVARQKEEAARQKERELAAREAMLRQQHEQLMALAQANGNAPTKMELTSTEGIPPPIPITPAAAGISTAAVLAAAAGGNAATIKREAPSLAAEDESAKKAKLAETPAKPPALPASAPAHASSGAMVGGSSANASAPASASAATPPGLRPIAPQGSQPQQVASLSALPKLPPLPIPNPASAPTPLAQTPLPSASDAVAWLKVERIVRALLPEGGLPGIRPGENLANAQFWFGLDTAGPLQAATRLRNDRKELTTLRTQVREFLQVLANGRAELPLGPELDELFRLWSRHTVTELRQQLGNGK